MADRRHKDGNWTVGEPDGSVPTWERVGVAVLMDIRDELKRLNVAIWCSSFLAIPGTLTAIKRNTANPRKKQRSGRKT